MRLRPEPEPEPVLGSWVSLGLKLLRSATKVARKVPPPKFTPRKPIPRPKSIPRVRTSGSTTVPKFTPRKPIPRPKSTPRVRTSGSTTVPKFTPRKPIPRPKVTPKSTPREPLPRAQSPITSAKPRPASNTSIPKFTPREPISLPQSTPRVRTSGSTTVPQFTPREPILRPQSTGTSGSPTTTTSHLPSAGTAASHVGDKIPESEALQRLAATEQSSKMSAGRLFMSPKFNYAMGLASLATLAAPGIWSAKHEADNAVKNEQQIAADNKDMFVDQLIAEGFSKADAEKLGEEYAAGGAVPLSYDMGCNGPYAKYMNCEAPAPAGSGGGGTYVDPGYGSTPGYIDTGGGGSYVDPSYGSTPLPGGTGAMGGRNLISEGHQAGDLVQDDTGNVYVVGADGSAVPVSGQQLEDLLGGTGTGGTTGTTPTTTTTTPIQVPTTTTTPIYVPNVYQQPVQAPTQSGSQLNPNPFYTSQNAGYYDLFGGSTSGTTGYY
jgi:hypothetical protein